MKCLGSKRRREERRIAQQAQEIQARADREEAEALAASFHAVTVTWIPPQDDE